MDVVELTDEVLKAGRWQLLDDAILDELSKHIIIGHISDILGTRQLVLLALLFLSLLLFLFTFTFLLLTTGQLQFQIFQLHLQH